MESRADRRELPANIKELKKITVRTVLERYRDLIVPLKRAAEVETYIVKALLRQPFANMTLAEARPQVFAEYRDMRLQSVKPVTVNRELSILHHAFKTASNEWGMPIDRNPIKQVKKPTANSRRERRLEQ